MADIQRIKGNISKMIAQNAPEADIDAYIAGEGVTLEQLKSGAKPDKYQQAAIEERDALKAKGIDTGAGYTRRLAQGLTAGFADEALAGLTAPFEAIKRGTLNPRGVVSQLATLNPVTNVIRGVMGENTPSGLGEGYNYAKAREDRIMDDARENTGLLGSAAEIAGGVGMGLGAARAGLTFARGLAPNAGLGARSLASAGDSAAMGALSGAGEGNSIGERFNNALLGGAVGGAVGGVAPGAFALLGQAASPVISNIRARTNPTGFAQSQVARGAIESGQTPQQLADAVATAAREGQGMFTLADAMGNAGQRMLSTTARAPGRARTDVTEFLDQRQAGQGRRIAGSLAEGFDAPQTAAQTRTAMTGARDTAADAAYGAVRSGSSPVNLVGTLNQLDSVIGTQPGQVVTAANDSIEAILTPFRQRLARVNPDDFAAVQRIRGDMADAAQSAMQGGYGNRARLIGQAVRALDNDMEAASAGFRQANRNFAQASRDIDAVGQGRDAAMRGRTEDIIPQFQGQSPAGQAAYRSGYVDPLIQQAQGAAFGANKARPLINDAFQAEAAAMTPRGQLVGGRVIPGMNVDVAGPLMQRRIGRENTMFQTRNAAMGNSKTAENLADDAAMGIDPTLVGQLLSGNWGGALRSTLSAGQNMLTGNTPQVREEVARILMQRGQNVNPANIQNVLDEVVRRMQLVQQVARQLGRGASGGLAVAPSALNQR